MIMTDFIVTYWPVWVAMVVGGIAYIVYLQVWIFTPHNRRLSRAENWAEMRKEAVARSVVLIGAMLMLVVMNIIYP